MFNLFIYNTTDIYNKQPAIMINLVAEDLKLNEQLHAFPNANLTVSIFGTQSSGKSTLMNAVFGCKFPVLNTQVTRERCTKGIWLQNIRNVNIIDTEGFDSNERAPQQKIVEKQVALLCLAVADVLIINMWMNEVGRYEGSHTHILKAIIKTSERIISSQHKKIIVVVRDCTEDADRKILREELSHHITGIVNSTKSPKSNLKFTIDYFMMSHYEEQKQKFNTESKQLLKMINNSVKKSNLSNYSAEDRWVYIRQLWLKITSEENEIDLRSIEDALRCYALERIRQQTEKQIKEMIFAISELGDHRNYNKFLDHIKKNIQSLYVLKKPKHIKEKDIQQSLAMIYRTIENLAYKQYIETMLPNEEEALIAEYQHSLDSQIQNRVSSSSLKSNLSSNEKSINENYKQIIKGLKESKKLSRKFAQKMDNISLKYHQHAQHLHSLMLTDLEKQINQEVDKQTQRMTFDGESIDEIIKSVEESYQQTEESKEMDWEIDVIWESVMKRAVGGILLDKIKQEAEKYEVQPLQSFLYDQSETIVSYYKSIQQKAVGFVKNLQSYRKKTTCEEFDTQQQEVPSNLALIEKIKELISSLITRKLIEQNHKFRISLVMIGIAMLFFMSEFERMMKLMGVRKKKVRSWRYMYYMTLLGIFGTVAYRNRETIQKMADSLTRA